MAAKKKTISVKRKTVEKTPKKKAKAKKEMVQTHAMEEKEPFQKTTLDQVWGDTGSSRYGTLEESAYLGRIKTMNRSDLHSHAVSVGILPVDNRELLTSRLTREFRKHILSFQKPHKKKGKKSVVSEKIRSILAEGK
jgi:hypothetical protein